MPGARAETISTIANLIAAGDLDLRNGDVDDLGKQLLKVRGIGPWTVDYFRMRGLGDPDAFPETDLILKQNAQRSGLADSSRELLDRATAWRPWRAYAAHHLWNLRKEME
jgi:3-methyladenine DNA glycosylase/8-oxoguanine DNA glycosylase